MKKTLLLGSAALLGCLIGYDPAAGQSPSGRPLPKGAAPTQHPPATAVAERALLDQYCVTCHDDELKAANLSLEKIDLTTVGDPPELWETVVRKLRAGFMPHRPVQK